MSHMNIWNEYFDLGAGKEEGVQNVTTQYTDWFPTIQSNQINIASFVLHQVITLISIHPPANPTLHDNKYKQGIPNIAIKWPES